MKFVRSSIARSALSSVLLAMAMMNAASAVYAQSDNALTGGTGGAQSGASNNGAAAAGSGQMPNVGTVGSPVTSGMTGGAQSAPALNNMRANGTSLYMNPDPRAPNVTGKAAPTR